MKALLWLVVPACLAGIAVVLWRIARRQAMRRRESELRRTEMLAEAMDAIRTKAEEQ
jgi:hypothetical protein